MTTTDLDDQLTALAAPVSDSACSEVELMAREATPRRLRSPRWVWPTMVVGAVALTAGAGTATIAMSHWGAVEMPLENIRNTEPIPVTWTTDAGRSEDCRVWVEIRNPQAGDQAALNQAVTDNDWSGLGQRAFDDASVQAGDPDGEARVGDALTSEIKSFAGLAFPGILWLDELGDPDARAVDAWGMTCAPEAG